jgi:hypothetical protein
MHDKGVPVLVDFNELPAAHAEAGLVDNLPVQEAKEASEGARGGALIPLIRTLTRRAAAPVQAPPAELRKLIGKIKGHFSTPKEWIKKRGAAPKLLGMEGLDSGQVADFNATGRLPSPPPPPSSESASTSFVPSTARVPGTPDYGAPLTPGRPSPGERVDALASNESIYGAAPPPIPDKYRMPAGYTPPAGSSVGRAWEGVAQNRKLLGELPGGAEYDQSAREHAYEGEQVYQSLRAHNDKTYQDMANKGLISPTKNEGMYADWNRNMQNRRDRAEMEARSARTAKEVGEKGQQGQWDAYQARGGWKQEYPKGTNFNIDVNDPSTQTPGMRRNIALGKVNKTRNQKLDAVEGFAGRQRDNIASRQKARSEFANRSRG